MSLIYMSVPVQTLRVTLVNIVYFWLIFIQVLKSYSCLEDIIVNILSLYVCL